MNFIKIALNLLGIGKQALADKAERKRLLATQEHEIIKAQTSAKVNRINSNTISDNEIDLETVRQKGRTIKDDVVTYLILTPLISAAITPFVQAYNLQDFSNLNKYVFESYQALGTLPEWYKYALLLVIIDVLGFRSFLRKVVDKALSNVFFKK